jgi:tRNA (mo5U34)-methyltransferase
MTTAISDTTRCDLQHEIDNLGPWFHNLHLPDGTQTCPNHFLGDFPSFKWRQLEPHIPRDLTGWTALDIWCNAGFYTIELARRGAHVLGIDSDTRYLRQAYWAARHFDVQHKVQFDQMQVYDLVRRDETFDLVLFMGVLYHLRYPMLGLDIASRRVGRMMVLQTLTMPGQQVLEETWGKTFSDDDRDRQLMLDPGWPKMAFLEHGFNGDPTNWWCPNHAAVEAMLRSTGMRVTSRPGHEMYICQPDPDRPACISTWNKSEFLAATGQSGRPTAAATDDSSPAQHSSF